MTTAQMAFAILLSTLAAICGFVTALVGIYVNSGRFDSIDMRLGTLEGKVSDLGERVSHLEGSLGGR